MLQTGVHLEGFGVYPPFPKFKKVERREKTRAANFPLAAYQCLEIELTHKFPPSLTIIFALIPNILLVTTGNSI